jgi:Transposase IS4
VYFDAMAPTVDLVDDELSFDVANWRLNELPVQPELDFLGKSGPSHTLNPSVATPFDYFCLFIPIFFWERWAIYTNKKAAECKPADKSSRKWVDTCAAELKAWVASIMWWCLFKNMGLFDFYHECVDPSKIKIWFPSWLRLEQIKRFIKLSDPALEPNHKQDKLYKVREIWDDFIARCKANYWPTMQIALDEAIKKFKGRCSFKQYIKNKPVRWGLKAFCLCCSATGYLWNACIYVGKRDEEADCAQKELSATTRSVLEILSPLSNKNHIVHMDNYYTSIPLFMKLSKMNTQACGTIRANRKWLCPQVSIKKNEERKLKKDPGYTRWASYGALCYIAWFAKRAVHVLTNCYMPTEDGPGGFVQHWFSEAGKKVQKEIRKPPAIKSYNLYMGAVDLFDQYRSYIALELRSRKFWHALMWFIFESALVNSWVLYKVTREAAQLPVTLSHFQFRRAIALALASEWENMGCRPGAFQGSSPSDTMKQTAFARGHLKAVTSLSFSDARFSPDKHVQFVAKIPSLDGSKQKHRQLYCRVCKTKRTCFWCKKCHQPLCREQCFAIYHTKPEPSPAAPK